MCLKWTTKTSPTHSPTTSRARCVPAKARTSDLTSCRSNARRATSSTTYSRPAHSRNRRPSASSRTSSTACTTSRHKASHIWTSNLRMCWSPTMTLSNWQTSGSCRSTVVSSRHSALARRGTTRRRLQRGSNSTLKRQICFHWVHWWLQFWWGIHCSSTQMQKRTITSIIWSKRAICVSILQGVPNCRMTASTFCVVCSNMMKINDLTLSKFRNTHGWRMLKSIRKHWVKN